MRKENEELEVPQIEKLIRKYEKQCEEMIVMDDYDGGQKDSLVMVIEDLKRSRWWTM